jgi:hypothetical protein
VIVRHPLAGTGAGTFDRAWIEFGDLVRWEVTLDAHSLYLETLAELGVVGLLVLLAALLPPLAAGIRGDAAAAVGGATARALNYRFRQPEAYHYPDGHWRTGFLGGYRCEDNGATLLDSAAQLYFWGGATSPAMGEKMVGSGSQYALAFVDATDAPFDGGRTYRLHVPPQVPVNNFWSVLIYDTQTRSMLQTDQEWPSVTSQDRNLTTNADGSVDIYVGPEPPTSAHNRIQTVPGKSWFAIFRLYGPLEPWFDKTWRLPDIEPVA